ncbi:MAG: Ig-like domain repeat protein [Xanthomonadales bacterium]|nr:Ig-like domain repeat protein [Xanthomonadales bacterium]
MGRFAHAGMKKWIGLWLSMLLPLVTQAAEVPLTFLYTNFSGAGSLLQFNGNAYINGTELRLNDALGGQAGSAFNQERVQFGADYSFSTYFTFQMLDPDAAGADGLTFTIQTSSNSALSAGGGLGYSGIGNSLAVEFDTYVNGGNDADPNHVAIDINGNVNHDTYTPAAGYYYASSDEFADGAIYHVWIDYNGSTQTMEVRLNRNSSSRPGSAILSKSGINLVSILGVSQAYTGFTAATGGSWESHAIKEWYFANRYEPINTGGGDTYVQASSNANLSSLSISSGTLSPAFSTSTTSYSVSVPYATTSVTVTPTVQDADATASVNNIAVSSGSPSSAIGLSVGNNTITVRGIAENGSTKTYTITVNRAAASPPTLTTTSASAITASGATTGGDISSDGGATVTSRGVAYSTSSGPTTSNATVSSGSGTGSFSALLSSLSPGTTYYVRAYGINAAGTGYGNEISFTTAKLDQTITFNSPGDQTYSPGGTFVATATASSGLGVSLASTTPSVCTGSGSSPLTVTIVAAGPCSLSADQAGNGTYNPAPQVSQTLTIDQAPQSISFADPGIQTYNVAGTFSLSATGGASGNAVTFSSNSPTICSVVGNTVSELRAGTCALQADQTGNSNYLAATPATRNVTILPAPTVTTIDSSLPASSARINQAVDVTVSVSGADPTGSVTVHARAGAAVVSSCIATLSAPSAGISSGSCTLPASSMKPRNGVDRLVASYSGDDSDDISTSTDFAFSVLPGDVVITPVVSDVTVVSGEVISVTVALDAVAPALGPVTGDGTMAPDLQVSTSEAGTGCSIDWDLTNVCSLHFTGVNNTSQLLTAMQGGDPKAIAAAKASLIKSLSVSYLATTDFHAAGPTATDPVTVSSAPTTTLLSTAGVSSATDPSIYGEGIRLTAVVTADAPSTITPRGLVQFTRDSDVLGTVALDGSGIASFDAPPRTTGSEIYYAFFLTNDDFVGSDDDDEHSVAKSPTATLISGVSPPSPQALQTVTVSANVAAVAPGAGTPTGSIVISGDNTAGCTISLPAASCDLSFATKGSKTLTATYTGDSQFLASGASSDTELVDVVGIPVTVSVTGTTPTPHYYGTAYTVAYTVSGGDGSFDGSVTITTAPGGFTCTGSASGGSGSCDILAPNGSVGSYDLVADYAGDSTDAGATSSAFSHAISQATTALVLSGNTVDPIDAAQVVTVSLNLSMTNGIAPLAGTITVSGLHTTGCSVTLIGGESFPQTCDLSFSVVGTREITATFTPTDALNVAGSSSNPISYDVIRAITTTEITGYAPASGVAQVGDAVTLSFTVSGGVLPYDGAVSVDYGSGPSVCAPVTFDTNTGAGSCTIPATDLQLAGDYPISVAYAGDADDVPSSDSDTLSVSARSTAITLASSPADNAEAGDAITWTVSVTPVGGAATTPISGLVHVCPASAPVCDVSSARCSIDLSVGTTCSLSYDEPQAVSLVAQYVGDANYAPSLSAADGITIDRATSSIAITSTLSAPIVVGQTVSVAFDVDGGHQTYDGTVSLTASLASPVTTVTCGPVSIDAATGIGSCAFSVADTTALLHSGTGPSVPTTRETAMTCRRARRRSARPSPPPGRRPPWSAIPIRPCSVSPSR